MVNVLNVNIPQVLVLVLVLIVIAHQADIDLTIKIIANAIHQDQILTVVLTTLPHA